MNVEVVYNDGLNLLLRVQYPNVNSRDPKRYSTREYVFLRAGGEQYRGNLMRAVQRLSHKVGGTNPGAFARQHLEDPYRTAFLQMEADYQEEMVQEAREDAAAEARAEEE